MAINMPMLMAVKPTHALTLMARFGVWMNATQQLEKANQRPVWRGCRRYEYGEARARRRAVDVKRVAFGIRLDRAQPTQPDGIAPRVSKLNKPLQRNRTEHPIEYGHRLSIRRKPAVKPGPRAVISARSQCCPVARAWASTRSSTNITVAADMLP